MASVKYILCVLALAINFSYGQNSLRCYVCSDCPDADALDENEDTAVCRRVSPTTPTTPSTTEETTTTEDPEGSGSGFNGEVDLVSLWDDGVIPSKSEIPHVRILGSSENEDYDSLEQIFIRTLKQAQTDETEEAESDEDESGFAARCLVTRYEVNGVESTIRSCSHASPDPQERCRAEIDTEGAILHSCRLCNEDLCNNAITYGGALLILVLSVVLNVLL